MSLTLNLAEQLISRPSVTPEDAGCLQLLTERLQPLGFVCEPMDSGPAEFRVQNLWSKRPVAPAQQAQAAIDLIVFGPGRPHATLGSRASAASMACCG